MKLQIFIGMMEIVFVSDVCIAPDDVLPCWTNWPHSLKRSARVDFTNMLTQSFYLRRSQKRQKTLMTSLGFLCNWDLGRQKLLVKYWWNWPLQSFQTFSNLKNCCQMLISSQTWLKPILAGHLLIMAFLETCILIISYFTKPYLTSNIYNHLLLFYRGYLTLVIKMPPYPHF